MNRRNWLAGLGGMLVAGVWSARSSAAGKFPLVKSKAEWKASLSPEAYYVLFEEGTERAGTSPLNHEKRVGTFKCAACN